MRMQLYKSRGIRGVFELTVIIPSHNKQRYIIDCLDSIYSQTLKVKEVIVFDDCSTDGTLNLLRHYQKTHNNLRIIESQTNVGVSKARDLAIRSAKTDYVTFIDADDYYFEKEKLLLLNTYPISGLNDSCYYLLNIWQQASYNQEDDQLYICGNNRVPQWEELPLRLKKYIRKLFIINPQMEFNDSAMSRIKEISFDMLSLISCE